MPSSDRPRGEVGGTPATRVVAPLDANPIALLISSLALRSHLGATRVVFHVLAAEPKAKMPNRLADCLASHSLDVELAKAIGARIDPVEMGLSSRLRDAAERAGNAERLILDISGAGSELAVRASDNARELWPAGFRVASYEARRNSTRIWPEPRPKGHRDELVRLDIGSSEDLGAGRVTAGEMLALYGLRLEPENPYPAAQGDGERVATTLRRVAGAVLESFLHDESALRRFRQRLGPQLAKGPKRADASPPVVLDVADVPTAIRKELPALVELGLACPTPRGALALTGPPDRNGAFLLAGGWLEILVAEAIEGALAGTHAVERNAGTTWGTGDPNRTTYAESDVVFVKNNHLVVVSCKNDFNEGHIFRHLDRLRAIVAEFGEANVRPVLVSTEPLKPLVLDRCAAYEIGTLSGNDLLSRLETDLGSSNRPHRTLDAILRAGWQVPAPGQS